jgi:hypothetical protein
LTLSGKVFVDGHELSQTANQQIRCPALLRKYSAFALAKTTSISPPSRPQEGRLGRIAPRDRVRLSGSSLKFDLGGMARIFKD